MTALRHLAVVGALLALASMVLASPATCPGGEPHTVVECNPEDCAAVRELLAEAAGAASKDVPGPNGPLLGVFVTCAPSAPSGGGGAHSAASLAAATLDSAVSAGLVTGVSVDARRCVLDDVRGRVSK